jgi:hypothetical protein
MSDTPHHLRRHQASNHETCRPRRAEQAECGRVITFDIASNRKQDALQTVAHEKEKRAKEEGSDGQQISFHFPDLGLCSLKKRHKARRCLAQSEEC